MILTRIICIGQQRTALGSTQRLTERFIEDIGLRIVSFLTSLYAICHSSLTMESSGEAEQRLSTSVGSRKNKK